MNYLESRYSRPDRLPPAVSFESLPPSTSYSPYGGQVTLHDVAAGWDHPRLVCEFRPQDFKPQHAIWYDQRLWVLGVEFLDVYDAALRRLARVADPWMAGGHTIVPDGCGRMLVSCSASDSVLVVDALSLRTVDVLRMPESRYGANYRLERSHSVIEHYITNDLQLTHVNCAWPYRNGVLTSALIPGDIGWFGPERDFQALLTGYVGCHGARVRGDTDEIYFSDSCTGLAIMLDADRRIRQRIDLNSSWLHDTLHIKGDIFACAVYDRKTVEFWDASSRGPVGRIDCSDHGAPQFLSYGR